jgi:hypothetical protein
LCRQKRKPFVHGKPLRELSGAELSFYGFKAMTTFGDVDDFKHFLPRLFEIMIRGEFAYDSETLLGKLDHAGWHDWENREREAVEDFLATLFDYSTSYDENDYDLKEGFLAGVIRVVKDPTPFLNMWLQNISQNKIRMLKFFVVDCASGLSNAFLSDKREQREHIANWLTSEQTVSVLEDLLLNDEFDAAAELSEILETIAK